MSCWSFTRFRPLEVLGCFVLQSLARYMPAEGIKLDVLTTRNPSSVVMDATLLREIHPKLLFIAPSLSIFRSRSRSGLRDWSLEADLPARNSDDNASSTKPNFLKRAFQDLLLPDPQVTWLPFLTRAARRIVRERKIDVVLVTGAPFSNYLLVERLRKEFPSLAIVADFRDEWLSTSFDVASFGFSRSERARRFAIRAEADAVTNANVVVAVTQAARCAMRSRYPHEPESKFLHLPNGFDSTRLSRSVPSFCRL